MKEIDLLAAYGFYRYALNEILDRIKATEDDDVRQQLEDASDALRRAFLAELFPICDETHRYPAVSSGRDTAEVEV